MYMYCFFSPEDVKIEGGKACVFPFKYGGKWYGKCTGSKPWCATVKDYDANTNEWGRCAG